MKKSTVILLILAIICILSLAGCSENSNDTMDSSIDTTATAKATEKIENTDEPLVTDKADPTGTAQTAEPTNSTVEPTKVPTQEPTKEPTKEPTTAPTTAPTATPTAVAQPTADPEKYPDDYGFNLGPIRSDGDIFFWKDSRVMYEIPDGAPDVTEWNVLLFDSENEQLIFGVRTDKITIYSIVEGDFYKLSEGEVVAMSQRTDLKVFYWLEANGIVKSIGVRSKNFGEVFLEAENIEGIIGKNPIQFMSFDNKKVSPIAEDVLLKITRV